LHSLQAETGGGVEAFEYMPRSYLDKHRELFPDRRPAFDTDYDVTIMVEVAATTNRDAVPGADGKRRWYRCWRPHWARCWKTNAFLMR